MLPTQRLARESADHPYPKLRPPLLMGAVTGRDRHVRVALAVLFVVEVMGVATAIGDRLPIGHQFWTVGQAAWIAVGCAGMLASSLRPAPDPRPVLDAIDGRHDGG